MKNPRILIVEDLRSFSDLIQFYLEKTQRFQVYVENRASHALAAAHEFRPDLILLDVDMPDKDGGDVACEIRSDRNLQDTPILFLTSLISDSEAGKRATMRGGMLFLAKPVTQRVLLDTVDGMLAGELACA